MTRPTRVGSSLNRGRLIISDLRRGASQTGIARPTFAAPVGFSARTDTNRGLIVGLGLTGGLAAVVGSALPWLSLYAGLQPITGLEGLNGRVLGALGAIAAAVAVGHGVRGGQRSRWLLGIAGFVLLAFAAWLGVQLLGTATALSADPLLVSRLEPGLGVSIIGASLVFATLFVPAARSDPSPRPSPSARHLVVVATLGLAGAVHLALTPEHLVGSIVLGLGFLGTGIAQLVLAAMVAATRSVLSVQLALIVSVLALAALVSAVTVGLPILAHGGPMGVLGPVESLDDVGALTGLVQAVTVAAALSIVRARGRGAAVAS